VTQTPQEQEVVHLRTPEVHFHFPKTHTMPKTISLGHHTNLDIEHPTTKEIGIIEIEEAVHSSIEMVVEVDHHIRIAIGSSSLISKTR
jgi:hypothetical protein